MALKPWYTVITPREDLRTSKPLDAAEFAVHLDKVRDGIAPEDYTDPERFFARTYLTQTLLGLAAEVVRRLSGERTETSAVFNLATQFGGGKTHALTLLYHLALNGPEASSWPGVGRIIENAGIQVIPKAATAVFVGTEFDSITGRGGADGTPHRRTPWGEIAYQLGGDESFAIVAEHDRDFTEPKGDVIRAFLPKDRPCLILMDEILNYVSTYRRRGYHTAFYNFIQALSETARGEPNVVLVVSIPASDLEYSTEDIEDQQRFKKMLDRLGKAYMMSSETETSEIIRRRLFEWDLRAIGQHGRVILPREAEETCRTYAQWINTHRQSLPQTFPIDHAREAFEATYPFHPMVFSVFERKWQSLPRFQQTRGVLRLLAHWVSHAYRSGYTGAHRDPLIDLGTAPLDDPLFRAALFEQLGEGRLEVPVTTDIMGHKDSHATRLDEESVEAIRKARLHRKVATAIFFESNGGQAQAYATLPEIRLATAAPDLDIANVETVLEALVPPDGACYYLDTNKNRYWFSTKPNLTKLLADRKASVQRHRIDERVQSEIEKVFAPMPGIERVFFPSASGNIPNQAAITLVIVAPDQTASDPSTLARMEAFTRDAGSGARTYKSALIWAIADQSSKIREEARKVLAWEAISDERHSLPIDDAQKGQIDTNLKQARGDLREAVWRAYNHIAMLNKDNQVQLINIGAQNSSAASSLTQYIINRLRNEDAIQENISPNFLIRNWPALTEWSTRAVRDAFFASPKFPRLLSVQAVRETIAKGVSNGFLAYVSKLPDGRYEPFHYKTRLQANEVELSDDVYIITAEAAEAYQKTVKEVRDGQKREEQYDPRGGDGEQRGEQTEGRATEEDEGTQGPTIIDPIRHDSSAPTRPTTNTIRRATWEGDLTPQKWMNFYMKVLTAFANNRGLNISVRVEIEPEKGLTRQQLEDMKSALRGLGLGDDVQIE